MMYMVMKGVQQRDGPSTCHLQCDGDGGSTSPKHMQW